MTRRYVRHSDRDTYIAAGWIPVSDLGIQHNEYSVLMWLCALSCKDGAK